MACSNIDCLSNKKDELENITNLNNGDVILICEILNINPSDLLAKELNFDIKGYRCLENNSNRGLCIIYKESIDRSNWAGSHKV